MKKIRIYTNETRGTADHFWAASGLDELFPLVHTEAGRYCLERMQSKGTCKYMRNHFTLNSCERMGLRCGGDVYREDEDGNPFYDFTWINSAFRQMVEHGIKPIVEMDFVPQALCLKGDIIQEGTGELQPERYIPADWTKWRALLKAFVENLQHEFGVDETRSWFFEVWNEPDSWPVDTWPNFYKLYDVFVDTVTGVDDQLRIGGPGCFKNNFMHPFLNHVVNGTNYVTGEKGTRIDFISYHIYGMSGGWLNEYPLIIPTVQRFTQELMWLSRTIEAYPSLRNVEIQLNEWGVVSNYERDAHTYPVLHLRNSEYSALFMVKLVDCIYEMREKYHLPLSLMLYWGFCSEDHFDLLFNGNRSLTTAYHITKPIGTVHEMLATMGETLLKTRGLTPGGSCGCFATRDEECIDIMLYRFDENLLEADCSTESFDISLEGLTAGNYTADFYVMDQNNHNTFRLWQRMGSKELLALEEAEALHVEEDLKVIYSEVITADQPLKVTLPSQSLVMIKVRQQQE